VGVEKDGSKSPVLLGSEGIKITTAVTKRWRLALVVF
jgi:hypothetical protein